MQMLWSEDSGVHYEAVGVLGNLVHSSQEIKQQVLQVRAASHGVLLQVQHPITQLTARSLAHSSNDLST
jgi:hypothetical protein